VAFPWTTPIASFAPAMLIEENGDICVIQKQVRGSRVRVVLHLKHRVVITVAWSLSFGPGWHTRAAAVGLGSLISHQPREVINGD
jgi:hypothetical protein